MAIPSHVLAGIRNLAPLPVTSQKLSAAIAKQDVSASEIARLIEFDEALSANILRVANSSAYANLIRLDEIGQAVMRLGINAVLHIALGDYLKHLHTDAPLYDLSENDLWLHGAVASLAVGELTQESPSGTLPRSASLAALLHDVGKLIIVRYMKADVRWLLAKCQKEGITFVQAERAVLGCDHAEVGGAIARKWSFPEEIVDALSRHHDAPMTEPSPTLDGVILGNLVAKTLGTGLGAEGMNFDLDIGASRRHGITFAGFCRACARTSVHMEGLKEAYGLSATSLRSLAGSKAGGGSIHA